jgi:hypothetical protein
LFWLDLWLLSGFNYSCIHPTLHTVTSTHDFGG